MPFSAIYVVLMYETYAQAVSIPAKTGFEYISSIKTLPQKALGRGGLSDIASELHSRPANLFKRLVTAAEGSR